MSIYNDHTYVYWIHLPEHSDIHSQGYVGVSKNPTQRLWNHHNDSKNNNHCNIYLSRILKKYSDQLIQTIVFEGEKDVCYMYEESIRPVKQIGWNINKGGICPPSSLGKILSVEHKEKISKGNTGKHHPHTEESKQKLSQANKNKSLTETTKQKIRDARKNQKFTLDTKKKLSDSHKGNIPGNAKSIKTPSGIFPSISRAATAYGVSIQTMANWTRSKSEFEIMAHI